MYLTVSPKHSSQRTKHAHGCWVALFFLANCAPIELANRVTASAPAGPDLPGPFDVDPEPTTLPVYRIPPSSLPPAPWLVRPAVPRLSVARLEASWKDVATGHDLGIVRGHVGYLAVHRRRGVLGLVETPARTRWVGLDARDRILAASDAGTLTRAESFARAASPGGFAEINRIPGALAWELAGDVLVCLAERAMFVSMDAGETFERVPLPDVLQHWRTLPRPDGVVVVQGTDVAGALKTYVRRPLDGTWRMAPPPLKTLGRTAGIIRETGSGECLALDQQARAWICAQAPPSLAWSAWTSLRKFAAPAPRAPPSVRAAARLRPLGRGSGPGVGTIGKGGGGGPSHPPIEPIRGTTWNPESPQSRWYRLFSDASCAPERGRRPSRCNPNARLRRPPHVAMWDDATHAFRSFETPHLTGTQGTQVPACDRMVAFDSLGGIAVLRCRRARTTTLWTADATGRWYEELTVRDTSLDGPLTIARDGTLLLHGTCGKSQPCTPSWLRSPDPLGAGHWSALNDRDALAYRVLSGGRALAINGDRTHGYRFSIVEPHDKPVLVSDRVTLDGQALSQVIVGADGSINLRFGPEFEYPQNEPPEQTIVRIEQFRQATAFRALSPSGGLTSVRESTSPRTWAGRSIQFVEYALDADGMANTVVPFASVVGDVDPDGAGELLPRDLGHSGGPGRPAGDFDGDGNRDTLFIHGTDSFVLFDPVGSPRGVESVQALVDSGRALRLNSAKLTPIGDFNGDGFDDLVVADPDASIGQQRNGRIVFVLGRPGRKSIDVDGIPLAHQLMGERPFDRLGQIVVGLGDLNGDRASDIAVGNLSIEIPYVDHGMYGPSMPRVSRGRIYVVYGGSHVGPLSQLVERHRGLAMDDVDRVVWMARSDASRPRAAIVRAGEYGGWVRLIEPPKNARGGR